VPLGPFLGKNFGTTISPWVITLDALAPFVTESPKKDTEILPYLEEQSTKTAYDVQLNVHLKGKPILITLKCLLTANTAATEPDKWHRLTQTNLKYMYWSIGQMIAHHTVNGCNLRTGDILATGTISGPVYLLSCKNVILT
jgi:fumarylacetoacetase